MSMYSLSTSRVLKQYSTLSRSSREREVPTRSLSLGIPREVLYR